MNGTVGGSGTLKAVIAPANATNQNIKSLESSDTGVVKVNASGKVDYVGVGTATITGVTDDGGKTATTIVTVTE